MPVLRTLVMVVLHLAPVVAHADLRVDATRVVYEESTSSATSVRLHNTGTQPSLIQVWIDEGNEDVPLETARPPLFVIPPVLRLEPGKNRDIQVRPADTGMLAKDRESLLWLNILDIPARRAGAGTGAVEVAMRWRLKLFHRPAGLSGSAEAAPAALRWSLHANDGGRLMLRATNPTPYFVSLYEIALGTQQIVLEASNAQVPPLGEWSHVLPDAAADALEATVLNIGWIDDKGLEHQGQAQVNRTAMP